MATIGHAVLPLIAGFQLKLSKLALSAMLFFAFLPDADILLSFALTGSPFAMHRGFTHSLLFACIPLALFLLLRRDFLFWGFVGALTHPLIDMLDAHGTPLLWPFSAQNFSFELWKSTSVNDITLAGILAPDTFITDKLLLAILIAYLAYYFGRRCYDSLKQGRRKPAKARRD